MLFLKRSFNQPIQEYLRLTPAKEGKYNSEHRNKAMAAKEDKYDRKQGNEGMTAKEGKYNSEQMNKAMTSKEGKYDSSQERTYKQTFQVCL